PLAEAVQSDTHEVAADTLNWGVDGNTLNLADELVVLHRVADARIGVLPQAVCTAFVLLILHVVPSPFRGLGFTVVCVILVKVLTLFIEGLVQVESFQRRIEVDDATS